MEFYDVLDQVLELLKQRGRVAYRALKRQFDLDDEDIEALKDELIYSQKLAVDEEERVLVWTGKSEGTPVSTSQSDQTSAQLATELDHPTQVEPPPFPAPPTPDAERRQLTVMFCDLADSTKLSGQLDPEDYRDMVRSYQATCSEVIQRYDGHVAQLLGDGLLVYFGYPQAHEDDAQRAVHAGLGIVDAIGKLNTRLEQDKDIRLAVRLGIHTGLVVVGEMGGAGRQEQLALGEVPNVTARIQGIAEPDTVVISDATYRLIEGYFACEPLGEQALRGVAEPVVVYHILRESGAQSRLDIVTTRGLTPLVGREQEVGLLLERWVQVKDGQGQVVLLSGEPGIGKSRLVQVLKDHVSAEGSHTRLECRSSPYFTNSALYPIIDMVQRTLRFQANDTSEQKVEKLEQNLSQYRLPLEETVPLFSTLLSLQLPEERYSPLDLSPQRQRQKTLESVVAIVLELSEQQPVLFILEDTHWADATSLELLDLLVDQTPTASIYTLMTCRPEFQSQWGNKSYFTHVTLNRLSRDDIEQMVARVTGEKPLPDEVIQQLVDKTDGVPLYVEEMTKAVLESGVLKETNGQYELVGPLSSLAIPMTLHDSLMSRLDRLVTAKAVAQYSSVLGRQFSYELLQATSQVDEETLQKELSRLVESELVYQRGLPPQATYTFKHALIQDTAYQSLLRSTRQGYHRRIAEVLEERFPETAESQPELLARHYTEARLNEQAVGYWHKAGQRASERSAHREAIAHLTKGLELLTTLPDTPERTQQELALQFALGVSLTAAKGYTASDVAHAYNRARELCQQMGETPQLASVLRGLVGFYLVRAEHRTVRELATKLLTLAQYVEDPAHLLQAHETIGISFFFPGELVRAHTHFARGTALYDLEPHHSAFLEHGADAGVSCLSYAALNLWQLGYPDQALKKSHEALLLARELSHPFSLAFAQILAAFMHQSRREAKVVLEHAEAVIALAHEHGFPDWLAMGTIFRGWSLAAQGLREEGIAQIRQMMAAMRANGAELGRPYEASDETMILID